MKKILAGMLLLSSVSGYACINGSHADGIVAKNSMEIPFGPGFNTGIDHKTFKEVIKRADDLYAPVIKKLGHRLVFKKKWFSKTVNAFAEKKGKKRIVEMHGGFARHPLTTKDSFMFVVCHEIGHHIGGEPMIRNTRELWASNEGQSDYFAGTKCMRKLLINEDNASIMANVDVPQVVVDKCADSFKSANEQALCQRISIAGFSLASLFRDLRKSEPIDFDTPDPKEVWRTWFLHPEPQCRLDTYFRSAICKESKDIEPDYEDYNKGFCSRDKEQEYGARPLCWFNPTQW
jgi:hypothetical protein